MVIGIEFLQLACFILVDVLNVPSGTSDLEIR